MRHSRSFVGRTVNLRVRGGVLDAPVAFPGRPELRPGHPSSSMSSRIIIGPYSRPACDRSTGFPFMSGINMLHQPDHAVVAAGVPGPGHFWRPEVLPQPGRFQFGHSFFGLKPGGPRPSRTKNCRSDHPTTNPSATQSFLLQKTSTPSRGSRASAGCRNRWRRSGQAVSRDRPHRWGESHAASATAQPALWATIQSADPVRTFPLQDARANFVPCSRRGFIGLVEKQSAIAMRPGKHAQFGKTGPRGHSRE